MRKGLSWGRKLEQIIIEAGEADWDESQDDHEIPGGIHAAKQRCLVPIVSVQ